MNQFVKAIPLILSVAVISSCGSEEGGGGSKTAEDFLGPHPGQTYTYKISSDDMNEEIIDRIEWRGLSEDEEGVLTVETENFFVEEPWPGAGTSAKFLGMRLVRNGELLQAEVDLDPDDELVTDESEQILLKEPIEVGTSWKMSSSATEVNGEATLVTTSVCRIGSVDSMKIFDEKRTAVTVNCEMEPTSDPKEPTIRSAIVFAEGIGMVEATSYLTFDGGESVDKLVLVSIE